MRVTILRWLAVLLPTAIIILLDHARHEYVYGFSHPWQEELTLAIGVLLVVFVTSRLFFSLVDRSQRHEREAETLRRIGVEVTSNLELGAILSSVLARGLEILRAECLGVALSDSPGRELVVQTRGAAESRRVPATECTGFLWEAMESNQWKVQRRGGTACVRSSPALCSYCLAIPLRMGSHVLGTLCVGSREPGPQREEDRKLAEQMANLTSAAISNALFHQRARDLATLEERDRIAREMHDSLAQVLGYLSMKAGAARDMLRRGEPGRADEELGEMARAADEAYLDVREAILGLRESVRTSGRLADSIERYLQGFSRRSGVAARLEAHPDETFQLPPSAEIQLVRVVQEALTNIRKHAHAANVLVKLERDDRQAVAIIEDDGQGFDPTSLGGQPEGGFGMSTMRERLSQIGGHLAVESAPGKGTRVTACIPTESDGRMKGGEA